MGEAGHPYGNEQYWIIPTRIVARRTFYLSVSVSWVRMELGDVVD